MLKMSGVNSLNKPTQCPLERAEEKRTFSKAAHFPCENYDCGSRSLRSNLFVIVLIVVIGLIVSIFRRSKNIAVLFAFICNYNYITSKLANFDYLL